MTNARNVPWRGDANPMPASAFQVAADEIGCEAATIQAVWQVEAAGRAFLNDGTLIRRFEPHKMPRQTWPQIGFSVPAGKAPWRASLALSNSERTAMFHRAFAFMPAAALDAASWGAPQIMGFNAEAADFEDELAMVEAMADNEAAQLAAFVRLVQAWGLGPAFRARDWQTIETRYNGGGFGGSYARKMESAYRQLTGRASPAVLRIGATGRQVRRLQVALDGLGHHIDIDSRFGPETDAAVRAFQAANGLTVDGMVGANTWAAIEAATTVAPPVDDDTADNLLDQVRNGSGAAAAASAAASTVREAMPSLAYDLLIYGTVALALIAAAAWTIRRLRRGGPLLPRLGLRRE